MRQPMIMLNTLAGASRMVLRQCGLWVMMAGALALLFTAPHQAQTTTPSQNPLSGGSPDPVECSTQEVTVEKGFMKTVQLAKRDGDILTIMIGGVPPEVANFEPAGNGEVKITGKSEAVVEAVANWVSEMYGDRGQCMFDLRVVPDGALETKTLSCGQPHDVYFNYSGMRAAKQMEHAEVVTVLAGSTCDNSQGRTGTIRVVEPALKRGDGDNVSFMGSGTVTRVIEPGDTIVVECDGDGADGCTTSVRVEGFISFSERVPLPGGGSLGHVLGNVGRRDGGFSSTLTLMNGSDERALIMIDGAQKQGSAMVEVEPGDTTSVTLDLPEGESLLVSCPGQGDCQYSLAVPEGEVETGEVRRGARETIFSNESEEPRSFTVQVTNTRRNPSSGIQILGSDGVIYDRMIDQPTGAVHAVIVPGGEVTLECNGQGRTGGCTFETVVRSLSDEGQ